MIKRFFVLAFLLSFSFTAVAEEEAEKPEPLDPAYMGEHKFVIVSKASTLYVSKLPGYQKPDDMQIIAKISAGIPAVTHLVRDADVVTMVSEPFNLQRLERSENFTVKAKVYMGHVDKGGMTMYEDISIEFVETLYTRSLAEAEASSSRHKYDEVSLGRSGRILIHQVQSSPSYDHLVLAYDNSNCLLDFVTSSAIPSPMTILQRMLPCGSLKPLYFNTEGLQ